MVLKASLIALAGFNTCEKIIIKAINSEAEISEDLSNTMLPPINRIPATVATPKNSEIGLANSNLLYIDRFCLP